VSHDAPARKIDFPREETSRGKYWWVRWVVLGIVAVVLAVEVALGWDHLAKAWTSLFQANWWCCWRGAGGGRIDAQLRPDPAHFAEVRRRTRQAIALRSAFYAANALSTTCPAAGAVGHVSASPATHLGCLDRGGVLAAGDVRGAAGVGLALLGLGGAFFLGAKNNRSRCCSRSAGSSRCCCWPGVASRPELIEGIGCRVLAWFNSARASRSTPAWRSGARR